MNQRYLIVIAGCTAVGKTKVAIQLAQHFQTEIISADSRQIYTELNIGVARPSPEEMKQVPHHMVATQSIHSTYDAASYEADVLQLLDELHRKHNVVIISGGTGLYLRAILEGLDPLPPSDPVVMADLQKLLEEEGIEHLQVELMERDPHLIPTFDLKNPRRVLRALSVMRQTGLPISSFWSGQNTSRPFIALPVYLRLDRSELHERINRRVDQMMEEGLFDEVKALMPYRGLPALETVGYQELFAHLDSSISLEDAIEQIKLHTRQYAKRQETWFKKYLPGTAFRPDAKEEILTYLIDKIKNHE